MIIIIYFVLNHYYYYYYFKIIISSNIIIFIYGGFYMNIQKRWFYLHHQIIQHVYLVVFQCQHVVHLGVPFSGSTCDLGGKWPAMFLQKPLLPSIMLVSSYGWWLKSCTTWDVWNPINNGKNYQPQLVQDFSHQQ